MAARDPFSVRLLAPSSWQHGVQVSAGMWRGLPVTSVGAFLSEFEFQRLRPRRALDVFLGTFDLIQVVAGTPAVGMIVARVQAPTCLFVATTIRRERVSLLAETPGLRGLWLRLMTGINAWSERRALRLVDHVFALSEYTRSQLSALVPRKKLSLGWPGIDTKLFHPQARFPEEGYILSVGRHSDPRKNLRLLLEAYGRLHQRLPNVPRLLLVGGEPLSADWTLAVEWGIADHIDVRVNVTSEVLASLYRRASLFVLSSDEEGLGIVLLEAMASGLPVVSTRCGGPETCVVEGETGYLTPVGDAEALAGRMQMLLEDDTLRKRLGRAGRRLTESRFSIEAAGVPFLAVYDRLLGGARDLS
jgi:glycosyltransferase involved in cell wall biosynthesis